MASSKDYLEYIKDQLSEVADVSYRPMMGEYIIYNRDRVIGGIYDDRFLVKDTPSARRLMPDARLELPYEGGKPMLLVDDPDDRNLIKELFNAMYDELPATKKRKKKE